MIRKDARSDVIRSAALLCACVIAIGAIWVAGSFAARGALDQLRSDGRSSAALHASLLRSELEKFRLVPVALADDPETRAVLASRNPSLLNAFDERLERLNANMDSAAVYLIGADGKTIAASNFKQPLSFVGSNYGFRAYFREALSRGGFEQFALGTVSRLPGLYIARRVSAGDVRGVVVLKVEFDQLEAEWRQSGMPAFVTDPRGVVLITSNPEWRFLTTQAIPAAQRIMVRQTLDFGDASLAPLPFDRTDQNVVKTLDGGEYVETVVATSKPGWKLHLLTPLGTRVATAASNARFAAAAIVLLLALSIGAIVRRQRRRKIQAAQDARAKAALEAEVDARTTDLRRANRKLRQEMAERKASETRLQETRDQLVQANKLASLGQITAGVAHEINQPVAAIRTYAENGKLLLLQSRADTAAGNLDCIVAMTDRIGAITGELRGFARKARGTVGPLAAGGVIDGALLLLRDRIERQNVSVTVTGATEALVLAERVRLEQVLMNLLVNALDAMEKEDEGTIRFEIRRRASWVDIDLADNGPGLPPDARFKLFQPFNTTKDDGLGLGLTISLDIMRELGGDLSHLPSAAGSCFRLRLKPA